MGKGKDFNRVEVKCPNCKRRLFDMDKGLEGTISIKCPRCKAVIAVSHHKKNLGLLKIG